MSPLRHLLSTFWDEKKNTAYFLVQIGRGLGDEIGMQPKWQCRLVKGTPGQGESGLRLRNWGPGLLWGCGPGGRTESSGGGTGESADGPGAERTVGSFRGTGARAVMLGRELGFLTGTIIAEHGLG